MAVGLAAMAIEAGMATTVVCAYGRDTWSRTNRGPNNEQKDKRSEPNMIPPAQRPVEHGRERAGPLHDVEKLATVEPAAVTRAAEVDGDAFGSRKLPQSGAAGGTVHRALPWAVRCREKLPSRL